ncbi:MAG: hypothetical protein VB024_03790 [Dysgonamonadaceae bacterium]|jgi:Spy/CpxP family protein refolding chaperone|nr:hypothetical protein [Dysgonamonadaceae bacterium]
MKKNVLFLLVALLSMSLSVGAQDTVKGRRAENGKDAQRMMGWTAKDRASAMAKQLELTADQTAKVEALFVKQDAKRAEQMEKQKAQRDQAVVDREARREEMKILREKEIAANDAELEAIIGKAKMDQWKAMRAERRDQMSKDRPGRGNPRK